MEPRILRGDEVAERIRAECVRGLNDLRARGVVPGLAFVVVGRAPASLAYVGAKRRMCERLGIRSVVHELVEGTTQSDLIGLVHTLNADPSVDAILVQSPPPAHIDEAAVVREIDPTKDVDGFHPSNVAKLAMDDPTGFVPCTPLACRRILTDAGLRIEGAHVVVVGRSLIVGKPLALLLLGRGPGADATVTVAHSRTSDLERVTRSADILIVAVGRPAFIGTRHVRQGAVVLDVGINRIPDPAAPRGVRLVGDVDFDAVAPLCSAITPVPGGVGPVTIAMLMANTVRAAAWRRGEEIGDRR